VEPTSPGPPPPEGITPGLWTGEGVCFFVNTEGTKIVEADACDQGKSFSASLTGVEIDLDFKLDADACTADVACGAAWDIRTETNSQSGIETSRATCLNEFGGIGYIIFDTDSEARVYVVDGNDLDGRFCTNPAVVAATPAQ
jgi:hypothetical protein